MPYEPYNHSTPLPSSKNTINSVTMDYSIRDFLLLKNIGGTDSTTFYNISSTINGSPKIGEPVLDTSINGDVNVIPSTAPITTMGIFYKDGNNINNNIYQSNATDPNQLVDIQYQIIQQGIFGNIGTQLGTPNNGYGVDDANLGGTLPKSTYAQYVKTLTLKNLYNKADEQIDVSSFIDDNFINSQYLAAHKQVIPNEGYLDQYGKLNLGGGAGMQAANVLGSIINGQGIGFNQGGVVTNFDFRSSLAGRVLGATGVINDTNLGIIGGQQLGFALGNNAAFNVQQEVLGKLNLQDNVLSLIKGNGLAGFRANYQITVPSSGVGKFFEGAATILGFTVPTSFLEANGSIFASENGNVENISRANAMLEHTGKGQYTALIHGANANINGTTEYDMPKNTAFRSGYAPGYAVGDKPSDIQFPTTGGDNIYAFSNGMGHLINILGYGLNKDNTASVIPEISISRQQKVEASGFGSPSSLYLEDYSESTIKTPTFTWGATESSGAVNALAGYTGFLGEKKSLLAKTQKLFNSTGMMNIVSAKGVMGVSSSQIETANGGGVSKGSAVLGSSNYNLSLGVVDKSLEKADDTYCRAWTTQNRYDSMSKLIRGRGLDTVIPYRRHVEGSVLDDNGTPKIAPYTTDKDDPKKFMFSLENLAWNDEFFNLLPCERGPGDLLTGKKGRIMWFPPYNIQFSESNNVEWDSNKFIGRGESVYTYSNTERSGNLSFQIIVDHPSYVNAFSGSKNAGAPDDNYVASFFAGCVDPSQSFSDKLTSYELDEILLQKTPKTSIKNADVSKVPFENGLQVYFPNDVYTYVPDYENGLCGSTPIVGDGKGCGIGYMEGQVTSKKTYNDGYNFGLNAGKSENQKPIMIDGTTFNGFSDAGLLPALKAYMDSDKGKNVVIRVVGFASIQGVNSANDVLAKKRSETIIAILKEQVLSKYTDIEKNKRIKYIRNTDEIGGKCIQNDGGLDTQDSYPCKIGRKCMIDFEINDTISLKPSDYVVESGTRTVTKLKDPFYGECGYFEKLKETDSFIFDKFRDKIKYFHPAFHSTTPEGLNSRLTFLLQCTRQGPTLERQGANNLAFGRPPVCILRIGDFYNTKIVMDSVAIDYEPLVWDLNPEGIGVQPMIANVSMSFKFIGGSTLLGPINKLQNALSFNYFANTQVYDVRADYLSKKTTTKNKLGGYQITNDAKEDYNGDLNKGVGLMDGKPTVTNLSAAEILKQNQILSNEVATNGVQTNPEPLEAKITGIESVSVVNLENDKLKSSIKIKLTSENLDITNEDDVKTFLDKSLVITVSDFTTTTQFLYEEIITNDGGVKGKGVEIFKGGYQLGNILQSGNYYMDIPNGNYLVKVKYNGDNVSSKMIKK